MKYLENQKVSTIWYSKQKNIQWRCIYDFSMTFYKVSIDTCLINIYRFTSFSIVVISWKIWDGWKSLQVYLKLRRTMDTSYI